MSENITRPESNLEKGKGIDFEKIDYEQLRQEISKLIKKEIEKRDNKKPYNIHFEKFSPKDTEELPKQLTKEDLQIYYRVTRGDESLTPADLIQWQDAVPDNSTDTLTVFRAWLRNQVNTNPKLAKQLYPGMDF